MSTSLTIEELERALADANAMGCDRPRLMQRLKGLQRRQHRGQPIDRGVNGLQNELQRSIQERERRRKDDLSIFHAPELPITNYVEAIRNKIVEHQVLVVAGETGSGKTTQLPKICLSAGRGVDGLIGCTQPRRIAARTIAARLCEEMSVELGEEVGYHVRFDERVSYASRIKLMTDGILLSETARDRDLLAYDTLIIDEAHERSLNIDFLLGYLNRLLPRRPDLRVIITSATIDTERFSAHFDNAPVIEVSGRSFPVEVRYRPRDNDGTDLLEAIAQAVAELSAIDPRADMLVFLPGERDIRDTLDELSKRQLRATEVMPLYARLSAAEQNRIFHPGKARRIILTTNVAETSLTVPRIRFVIDAGTARISRYSHRSKVQRLPIEPISQASANQRLGRCGRLGPGVCVRLYDEEDFQQRAEFTEPEIVRTNLASVILQMDALGLGPLEEFPFLDPPDERLIRDGYQLLFELGAQDPQRQITRLGRELSSWPLDVRLSRLLIATRDQGCLAEGLVLAAALSIQDPRERPLDAQARADEMQAHFRDKQSDFVGFLTLWSAWSSERRALSQRKLRTWCRDHFLSVSRMREWSDVHRQLKDRADELGWSINPEPAAYDVLHKGVVSAFVGQVGYRDEKGYVGARQHRFQIFPGSGLFRSSPAWLVSAFLMETGKVYARVNARIEPEWVEAAAGHLVKRHHYDPFWSKRAGRVYGYEQVTLYGIPLIQRRRIHFGPHDPEQARRIFIREALVNGQIESGAEFLRLNAERVSEVEALEERQRRRDLLVDADELFAFFDAKIPADMHNTRDFNAWRKQAEAEDPQVLVYGREDLMMRLDHGVAEQDYPDRLQVKGMDLHLSYSLDPGKQHDGITVHVPLSRLNSLDPAPLEWLVPGLVHEKVTALIKSLPKVLRRQFVPAPDIAREFLDTRPAKDGSLKQSLLRFLNARSANMIQSDDFRSDALADHLGFTIAVEDGGRPVDQGRDLEQLQVEHASEARQQFLNQGGDDYYVDDLKRWDFGALPLEVDLEDGATGFPALVDQEDAIGIRLFETRAEAEEHHRYGLRRLLEFQLRDKFRYLGRNLDVDQRLFLQYASVDTAQALKRDMVFAVSMAVVDEHDQPVRDAESLGRLCDRVRTRLVQQANELESVLGKALERFHQVRLAMAGDFDALFPQASEDLHQQMDWLIYPGFLTEVPIHQLRHYPRYFSAVLTRIERLADDPTRDAERQQRLQSFWVDYLELSTAGQHGNLLESFHWQLEEYRVSLFAQELKTAHPVSPKRLRKAWREITGIDHD